MMTRLERRHEEAVTAALGAGGAARSSVVASWMRSARHHGLAPSLRPRDERMTQAELAQIRARMEPVLVSAQPTLDGPAVFVSSHVSGLAKLLIPSPNPSPHSRGRASSAARSR